VLRRLEKQGMLDSEWSLETSRPRRYYVLNQAGRETLDTLTSEWRALTQVMDQLLGLAAPAQETRASASGESKQGDAT
jgi:DNA-binding PadR family transcriptional regulator